MSRIYICFLWHMHQPFYKDLVSGEYQLPWTRLHALKDYYGMVKVLGDFPQVHQTFNLVPSLMVQIEEYAAGEAIDPFFRAAVIPAETLSDTEKDFILGNFFHAHPERMIRRYPRYHELYGEWQAVGGDLARARRSFGTHAFRDLQVLSQIAWFDEEYLTSDPLVRSLVEKGRDYTVPDQEALGRKQIEVMANVLPVYREFAATGQIEISTTPFYHPILPLLCDTNIADISHPYIALPPRFRYPQDAREQLTRGRSYTAEKFGVAPAGLWPSEGSVSDEALRLASDAGFTWFASDNEVLARTLGGQANPHMTYQPWVWRQDGREMTGLFRDHELSDLIGFVYNRMGPAEAARDFLRRVRENCEPILRSGSDALVPVFLDGENAWEYYEESGRPFLRELYRLISEDRTMSATTVTEALHRFRPKELKQIFPGSWIDANFDIWIGADEDNKAWEYLLKARQTYDAVMSSPAAANIPEYRRRLAREELLIAEGSDWNWWYGPEHRSHQRTEFDRLYRSHLSNVYTLLGLDPPPELAISILRPEVAEYHEKPARQIHPVLDGQFTSTLEWSGAGIYRLESQGSAMHGSRAIIRELHYGHNSTTLFLCLELVPGARFENDTSICLRLQTQKGGQQEFTMAPNGAGEAVKVVCRTVCEIGVTLPPSARNSGVLRFQVSLCRSDFSVETLPAHGWIELTLN